MSWTCVNTEERVSEYLEGQLPAAERLEMEAHLAVCAVCRGLTADVGGLVARLARVEPEVEPSGLIYRILQATSGVARVEKENLWRRLLAGVLAPRFALGLGSVAATLFILFQALGINLRHFSAEDLNPINMVRAADRQAHLTYARGMRFVNEMRVVYEIRSRLQDQEVSAGTAEPRPGEPARPSGSPSPQTEQKLRNDLMLRRTSQIAAVVIAGMPSGGPR